MSLNSCEGAAAHSHRERGTWGGPETLKRRIRQLVEFLQVQLEV
jgi:hypothetical protein